MRHLIINLESPLMAFGGEAIDNYGVTRRFPAASMLTGLLANALGWRRVHRQRHQQLQDRLVFAARIDREPSGGGTLTDFQTAQLNARDRGWTTRGRPESRAGGPATYLSPHLRYRDYLADGRVTVALRLEPEQERPTLDDIARALQEPARPLFIGRKPCLPSTPLFAGCREANSALQALKITPLEHGPDSSKSVKLLWPRGEGAEGIDPIRSYMLTDQRNWISGLHGGGRLVFDGTAPTERFPSTPEGGEEEQE